MSGTVKASNYCCVGRDSILKAATQQVITQKMADQERFDVYTIIDIYTLKLQETLITLLFQLVYVSNQRETLNDSIWSSPVIILITYQTQKLRPQRIMVKLYKSENSPGLLSLA